MAGRGPKTRDNGASTLGALDVVEVDRASIVPNPRNPCRHPESQITKLAASLKRYGQPKPIIVRKANRMISAGHGIWEAAGRAGLARVRVVLWDVDQETADAFMIGDNRLASLGRDDAAQVKELLRSLGFADPHSLGYDAAEIDELMKDAAVDIVVSEVPVEEVQDKFWISVRGPLAQQAATLKRLRTALADVPEVSVELGTVAVGV